MNKIGFVFIFLIAIASAFSADVSKANTAFPQFLKSYRLYDHGDDIRSLQAFLNQNGFEVASQGPGSSGNETPYFGLYTFRALKQFQTSANLPATGFFGPMTRGEINSLQSSATSEQNSSANADSLASNATSTTRVASSATSTNLESTSTLQSYYPKVQNQTGASGGGSGGGGSVAIATISPSCSLSASSLLIAVGSSTLLTWSSANALAASFPATHSTALSGSLAVWPATTTTYALTVSNQGTLVTCSATVVAIPPDTIAPIVSVTSPTTGTTVTGSSVAITATATDNIGVTGFTFYVDGSPISSSFTAPPFTTSWDSTSVFNGLHTLSAVAKDAWSNYSTTSINLIVSNSSLPLATSTLFAPTSFWYTPIPTNVQLNASSSAMNTNFNAQIAAYFGDVNINFNGYNQPIYIATSGTPTLNITKNGGFDAGFNTQFAAVPIPSYAQPAQGNDREMTVYQPSTDKLWEFYQATSSAGSWSASWGGGMSNVSTSNGIWPNPYGATATGLPDIGGMVKIADVQSGVINHVMAISINDAAWGTFSWPANRTDGGGTNLAGVAIPEGARFRLDPTLDLSTYNLTPLALIVAKAAQIYGFVVTDRSGGIEISAENPLSYTTQGLPDPWPAALGSASTTPSYALFNNFPWNHLQFMPLNY